MLPALGNAARKFTMGQVVADEANLACALERYRLAKGKLPEALPALKAAGCFSEIIQHRTRLFVPTDRAAAILAVIGN